MNKQFYKELAQQIVLERLATATMIGKVEAISRYSRIIDLHPLQLCNLFVINK